MLQWRWVLHTQRDRTLLWLAWWWRGKGSNGHGTVVGIPNKLKSNLIERHPMHASLGKSRRRMQERSVAQLGVIWSYRYSWD